MTYVFADDSEAQAAASLPGGGVVAAGAAASSSDDSDLELSTLSDTDIEVGRPCCCLPTLERGPPLFPHFGNIGLHRLRGAMRRPLPRLLHARCAGASRQAEKQQAQASCMRCQA